MNIASLYPQINQIYITGKQNNTDISSIMLQIYSTVPVAALDIAERVHISSYLLKMLSKEDRKTLTKELLEEQVTEQRDMLSRWSLITAQSSQIDTGYIAQHIVSLQTQIAGQGMRGKGDDLSDGSEVKSANFLDSMDKKGAVAPRWNFTAGNPQIMEQFLNYNSLYLLSMDLNTQGYFRTRIWKVNVLEHLELRNRYIEWMNVKGYPKFKDTEGYPSVNFQLFPPTNCTDHTFARHGNSQKNGFPRTKIYLEGVEGAELIFKADETESGIVISKF